MIFFIYAFGNMASKNVLLPSVLSSLLQRYLPIVFSLLLRGKRKSIADPLTGCGGFSALYALLMEEKFT